MRKLCHHQADPSAAWRHIHGNGHYTFHSTVLAIDLGTIAAGLDLVRRKFLGFGLIFPYSFKTLRLYWGAAAIAAICERGSTKTPVSL